MKAILRLFFKIMKKLDLSWKRRELQNSFSSFGKNFRFDPDSTFVDSHEMSFGENVFINKSAHFSGEIRVGNDVMFGPNVTIFAHDHYFAVSGKALHEMETIWNHKAVNIGNHCWIGSNCVIVAGTNIQDGTVVAAGSVVKDNNPPYCLIAGAPAKPVRLIFSDSDLKKHLKALSYSESLISDILNTRIAMTKGKNLKSVHQHLKVLK